MKLAAIESLINDKREIEFFYNSHRYSITYYSDNRVKFISVCEFYRTPIDVSTPQEVFNLFIGRRKLSDILTSIPDSHIFIH